MSNLIACAHPSELSLIMHKATPFLSGLSPLDDKLLTACFDAGMMSSDSGPVLLREMALRLHLAEITAKPLPDDREPKLVIHFYCDKVLARMMAIAAGYEDCDDLDSLRTDPALKLASGRGANGSAPSPIHRR